MKESRRKKVLFVCVHNSARSQIAEALLNRMCGNEYEAESAGLSPGSLNPLAVEVLREIGIDISDKPTRSVFDVVKAGRMFACVITVCDETSAERCPIFPGITTRLHWSFSDPARFEGTWNERLAQTRQVRDMIEKKLQAFCASGCRGLKGQSLTSKPIKGRIHPLTYKVTCPAARGLGVVSRGRA